MARLECLGRSYIGARNDTTQQTNSCLGIHRQTRVATFYPTSLSRLIATAAAFIREPGGLFALSVHCSNALWNLVVYEVHDKWIFVTAVTILIYNVPKLKVS